MNFAIRCPTEVLFGWGSLSDLGKRVSALGGRALLVTGRHALRRTSMLQRLAENIESAGAGVVLFDAVEPEPSLDTVARGIALALAEDCDVVAAVGGGSAVDVGKAVAALARADTNLEQAHAGQAVTGPALPIVAVPTTAGTGAEVTPNSVLTDPASGVKSSIRGEGLIPRVAIVDPEPTLSLPPRETALTGLDAFIQALEAFVSKGANPYSDALAHRALRATGSSLRQAVASGDDREAREQMALGSLLAGLALASARLGLIHGLAHPLGALCRIPHGLACALMTPHVVRFNLSAAEAKYAAAARAVGVSADSDADAARSLLEWVERLCSDLNADDRLSALGATESDLESLIAPTLSSGSTKHNPRDVDESDVRAIIRAAL